MKYILLLTLLLSACTIQTKPSDPPNISLSCPPPVVQTTPVVCPAQKPVIKTNTIIHKVPCKIPSMALLAKLPEPKFLPEDAITKIDEVFKFTLAYTRNANLIKEKVLKEYEECLKQ